MDITIATVEDLPQILQLQYLAYQSEAEILKNFDIPPLKQTLEEVRQEYNRGIILKAVNENFEIIGSVRGYVENDVLYIGKLMVNPKYQGRGIGTELLSKIEELSAWVRCELFTSSESKQNIRLYEKNGYTIFKSVEVEPGLMFVYLEKYK